LPVIGSTEALYSDSPRSIRARRATWHLAALEDLHHPTDVPVPVPSRMGQPQLV